MLNLPEEVVDQIKRQITNCEPTAKLTFTDFLTLLQKEAFFRECLSDAQMYKMSAQRLQFNQECNFKTTQQLEILKQMKKQQTAGSSPTGNQKMPNFSYLIEHMILFEYQGTQHLMVSFENKSVQIIDFEKGESQIEFDFDIKSDKEKEREKRERIEKEKELMRQQ